MKQIRIMAIVFTALMLAVLVFALCLGNSLSFRRRDIGEYNDMIFRINEEYRAGTAVGDLEEKYRCRIILSRELVDDRQEAWQEQADQLRRTLLMIWGLVLAAGWLFILAAWITVAKPIREFEGFAGEVAKGNLEVQLPRRRLNLFGNFTESFDLMREELRDSREREVRANKAMREMAAGLSHDIKTPVSTIRAACEVLEAKYPEQEDLQQKVSVISAKTNTINELVNNLFHTTLEELEELPVTTSEVSAARIEGFFADMNQQGDILFDNHIPECLVCMDPIRMEQAVDNVVSNSRKYAGTDIHVSFDEVESAGGEAGNSPRFIRITVRDAGPGVPEEELAQITGKYFRGSNAAGQVGYGLGMYLVRWYMEKQGGGLEYYNDNGFVVELLVKMDLITIT